MNTQNIKIVADSSSDVLTLQDISFSSAPLKIITSEKEYTDNENLDVSEMADELIHYKGKSSTACPSVGDWLSAFGDAEYVFCITITSALSGSFNSACIAKESYEQQHPDRRVFIIDSLSTGPEMMLIIEKLRECILSGKEFDEICEIILHYKEKTHLFFILESMRNLANNGRVSHLSAKAAGLLGIRIVGRASEKGTLELLDKSRGEKRALSATVRHLKEFNGKIIRAKIGHCQNKAAAELLSDMIKAEFPDAEADVYELRGLCSFYAEKGGLILGVEEE